MLSPVNVTYSNFFFFFFEFLLIAVIIVMHDANNCDLWGVERVLWTELELEFEVLAFVQRARGSR